MTFAGTARVHKSLPAWRRVARAGTAAAAMAVLLSACGGGDQVKEFEPGQFVSFGDENSALVEVPVGSVGTLKGMKYGVNYFLVDLQPTLPSGAEAKNQQSWALFPTVAPVSGALSVTSTPTSNGQSAIQVVNNQFNLPTDYTDEDGVDFTGVTLPVTYTYAYNCAANPLWVQLLASSFGLGFKDQCPSEGASGAVTYAENGATVATTATQVATHRGRLGSGTLVTMMAGQNDILNAFALVKAGTLPLASAKAEMTAQGGALAAIVNDIIKTGARVLVVKLPDMGVSPLARENGGVWASTLTELTLAFNNGILNKITNDGTKIGLVNLYDYTHYIREANDRGNSYDNIVNSSVSVCTSATVNQPDGTALSGTSTGPLYGGDPLLYCNSENKSSSVASPGNYFWSDKAHMGVGGHAFLAARAYERADDNPF